MLVMANGMQNGFMRLCPFVAWSSTAVANVFMPPMAVPIKMPHLPASSPASRGAAWGRPASSRAFLPATMVY